MRRRNLGQPNPRCALAVSALGMAQPYCVARTSSAAERVALSANQEFARSNAYKLLELRVQLQNCSTFKRVKFRLDRGSRCAVKLINASKQSPTRTIFQLRGRSWIRRQYRGLGEHAERVAALANQPLHWLIVANDENYALAA